MPPTNIKVGDQYGHWTVLARDKRPSNGGSRWWSLCDLCQICHSVLGREMWRGKSTRCRSCSGKGNANSATIHNLSPEGRAAIVATLKSRKGKPRRKPGLGWPWKN